MTVVLVLPWSDPPIRENDRDHWRQKAERTKAVRAATGVLARNQRVQRMARAEIRLVWTVTDRRRRDSAAPNPTLKAAVDGLVDADVLADDHHLIVPRMWCEIEHGPTKGVRIEITELGDEE